MKKLFNKKGFTLMEMMIVIAIIVILVAIAVPSFNSSLEKANKASDEANFKAARSEATLLAVDKVNREGGTTSATGKYVYNIATGALVPLAEAAQTGADFDGSCKDHLEHQIQAHIAEDGTVTVRWTSGKDCDGKDLPTFPAATE